MYTYFIIQTIIYDYFISEKSKYRFNETILKITGLQTILTNFNILITGVQKICYINKIG